MTFTKYINFLPLLSLYGENNIHIMSELVKFTDFTDYENYFTFPLPFGIYVGLALVAFGIILCIIGGIGKCFQRLCCHGEMTSHGDEFSSTQRIVDIEMKDRSRSAKKHRTRAHVSVVSIEEESSHPYVDIDNIDDYENVKKPFDDSDDDDDYENLRDGV